LEQLYSEFRKQHNIISLEKIIEIPEKYNIGKRPLSLLLGWGEQTFSRYYDGDMPTQQYSAIDITPLALQKLLYYIQGTNCYNHKLTQNIIYTLKDLRNAVAHNYE
jgi:hypothetical protein